MESSRMPCRLTYFLCQPCGKNFLEQRRVITRTTWCIGILFVLSILGPVLAEFLSLPQGILRLTLLLFWGGFLVTVVVGGLLEIKARRYIGLKATLENEPLLLVLSLRNGEVTARIGALLSNA